MERRDAVLPLVLLIGGLVIVLGAYISSTSNDLEKAICKSNNSNQRVLGETTDLEDCDKNGERIWYIMGGGLAALGLLGFVIRSATASAIDETPRPTASASGADELQKWAQLHDSGKITDDEFAAVKKRLLG